MSILELIGLTKDFKQFKAVDNLNVKIEENKIIGFLGPNGAGKTTTLKMITGLIKPTKGSIIIDGKDIKTSPAYLNKIGYLPDVPNFYNWMNAKEFLQFCGSLYNIEKIVLKERVNELLELVGLKDEKKVIETYSRGMKQRLGIAQALINNPKIIFLDEPTSALDPIGRKEVLDIIIKLKGSHTVFFSTHILADVERVCDEVIILNKGKIIINNTIENIKSEYITETLKLRLSDLNYHQQIVDYLREQPWVVEVIEDTDIKVIIDDIKTAQREIPAYVAKNELGLVKFIFEESTLEDIFMKVVDVK